MGTQNIISIKFFLDIKFLEEVILELLWQIRTYFLEVIWQIKTYVPEPIPANKNLFAETPSVGSPFLHKMPAVAYRVCLELDLLKCGMQLSV